MHVDLWCRWRNITWVPTVLVGILLAFSRHDHISSEKKNATMSQQKSWSKRVGVKPIQSVKPALYNAIILPPAQALALLASGHNYAGYLETPKIWPTLTVSQMGRVSHRFAKNFFQPLNTCKLLTPKRSMTPVQLVSAWALNSWMKDLKKCTFVGISLK